MHTLGQQKAPFLVALLFAAGDAGVRGKNLTISIDKLLVLKVFNMGHAVVEKKTNISVAIEMVNAVIRHLKSSQFEQNKIRLLFYLLLKSEILRETKEAIEIRQQAKILADEIGGNIYSYYMKVEEATQAKIEVGGFGGESIKPGEIKSQSYIWG